MASLYDIDYRILTEFNAYKLEIQTMISKGRRDLADELKKFFVEEIDTVRKEYGDPNDLAAAEKLIQDLLNL